MRGKEKKTKEKKEKTKIKIAWTRRNKLLLMVGVFLLFLGCYYLMVTINQKDETAADTSVVAFTTDPDDITAASFINNGDTISFTQVNGSWVYDADDTFPLNEKALTSALNTISEVSATREITDVTDFSQYGLSSPTYEIKLTSSADGEITLDIGISNTLTSEYYFRVNGGSSVYMVDSSVYDVFACNLYEFIQSDSIPSLTDVTSMTFNNAAKTTFVHYANGYDGWYSDKYTWFIKDGDTLTAANSDDVDSLVTTISGLTWSSCVAYNVSDDALAQYGLDDPAGTVKVKYKETAYVDSGETDEEGNTLYDTETAKKTFKLLIGDSITGDDGTTYYYTKTADSSIVYLISSDTAKTLLDVSETTCPVWDVCEFDRTALTSVDIAYGDNTYTLKVSNKSKESSDGEITTSYSYTLGGDDVDGGAFLDELESIQGMKTTDTPENATGDVDLTLTFHQTRDGFETMVMTFTKYSDDYYLVTFNGESTLLISTNDYGYITGAVDDLVGTSD